MRNVKVSHKNGQLIIRTKIEKDEAINPRELQIFQTKLIRGLLRPVVEKNNQIQYVGYDGVSLKLYLKRGITKDLFFIFVAQIIETLKKLSHYGFSANMLLMDLDYIFINEVTHEVSLLYQPIVSTRCYGNVFQLFYEMIHEVILVPGEDVSIRSKFMQELQKMQYFSTEEVEAFILRESPQTYHVVQRQKDGQSEDLYSRKLSCSSYGAQEEGTTLLVEEGTTLLDEEEGTTLLEEVAPVEVIPYMIRLATSEKFEIRKTVYAIGKDPMGNDCVIRDNRAISRCHAKITKVGSDFYLEDCNSTNGTMVNGQRIVGTCMLKNRDCIMFANENFEFYTE